MTLTDQQISTIKNYINTVLDYDDLKLEVIDHFISDIEEAINKKKLLFEDAFIITKIKWNKSFKKRISPFYFGRWFSAPNIVIKHATKIFKPFFFTFIAIYSLAFFAFKFISLNLNPEFILIANKTFKILAALSTITFTFVYLKILFSKVKSIYTFIIKTQFYFEMFLFISLISDNYFNYNKVGVSVSFTFFITGLYGALIVLFLYIKHIKIVNTKKYQIAI